MYKVSRVLWLWLIVGLQPAFAAGSALEANPYFKNVDELTKYLDESSDFDFSAFSQDLPDALVVEPGPKQT